jgi:hypothetical protein
MIKRVPRVVTPELMAFHRGEQMARLRKLFGGRAADRRSRAVARC